MKSFHALVAFECAISLVFLAAACGGSGDVDGVGGVGGSFVGPQFSNPGSAWSLSFAPPVLEPAKCSIAAHDAALGAVTTDTQKMLVSRADVPGVSVTCSIATAGEGFAVNATASQGGKVLSIQIPSIDSTASEAAPATGTLTYASAKTSEPYTSPVSRPCSFYFVPGSPEGVLGGFLWVSFSCPAVIGQKTAEVCSITKGVAVFENCPGG